MQRDDFSLPADPGSAEPGSALLNVASSETDAAAVITHYRLHDPDSDALLQTAAEKFFHRA